MKLYLSILEKLIELPTSDPKELRHIFDELGLEVKDILSENGQTIFNIESLANRGDHLYALGVAREISARYLTAIKYPPIATEFSERKTSVPAKNLCPQCYRYALLEMSLPKDMKLRQDVAAVMQSGEAAHHPVVDLLNYIQLELGQPMHAFDHDKIEGEIVIDLTKEAQDIAALDGKSYRIPSNSIVIRDKHKIVAVGGVIGCANSMITPESTRVLVESACFDPVFVRKTARAMNISTDASYAFERGSDRDMVVQALRRLVYLAEGGGGVVKSADSTHVLGFSYLEGAAVERRKVSMSLATIRKEINSPRLGDVEVTSRLKNLGYGIESLGEDGKFRIAVPSWRLWDVQHEQDLVEDFVRSHGLSRVKLELPPLDYEQPQPGPVEALYAKVEPALLGQGFYEVMTRSQYSGDEVALLAKLDTSLPNRHLPIKNAAERNCSHLKLTNIIHLSRLAEQNHRKGVLGVKVFEFGRLFDLETNGQGDAERTYPYERDVISLAASGRWFENEWKKPEPLEECLYLLKGVIEGVFKAVGCRPVVLIESEEKLLHPGYQGTFKIGRMVCGFFGQIHPLLQTALELRHPVIYAELDVESLLKVCGEQGVEAVSEYPAIRRDITLKVGVREFADRIIRDIRDAKPACLSEVVCVDDFRKPEEDFRRLSFRLTFQSLERTLEHAEVDQAMQQLLACLKEQHRLELAV